MVAVEGKLSPRILGGNGVAAGTVNYTYYNANWQAVETRTNGTAASDVTSQMVWSAAYINAAILQDTYSAGVIQPNSRLYFLQDANWDTTAVVGFNSTAGTWGVTQRYVYSPYGSITVLNADWSTPPAGTQPVVNNLYQGMTLDAVTGLYYERFRDYSPDLGVWISQDPAGYVDGSNIYYFESGDPIDKLDMSGLIPSVGYLAGVIWAESGLLFPQFNKKGPQNGTNYSAASQASLNLAREDIAIVASVNPKHAKPTPKAKLPTANSNRYVFNEWEDTQDSAKSAHAWLMKNKCRPDLHFFIWPSANGRTPSPGHQGNPWVYQYPIIQVLGPFRKPSRGGDVPIGNNIYIFIYSSPAGK